MAYADLGEPSTELKYFTLMRDPLKLCASRFQYKVNVSRKENLEFEEWIQRDWPRNHQTKWIAGVEDVDEAVRVIQDKKILVGLTERFDESMVLLKGLVANDLNISYRRVNVARDKSLAKHLLENDATRQMLIEAQRADLQLYEYVRRELYPALQREYGPTLEADVAQYRESQGNGFSLSKLTACRLKHYLVYDPLLRLHRRGIKLV
jgi:hypothetical protein